LELGLELLLDRWLLVLLEHLLPDVGRARRSVATPVPVPPLVVLGGRDERPVEALTEALERVGGAEKVPALAYLLVRGVRQRLLVDDERLEHLVQHAALLDIDDELLVAGDECRLEPARRVHDEVRAGEKRRPE